MKRVGVFVCHCGTNIAKTVDVEQVAKVAGDLPNVVFSTDYTYMCSEPGQDLLKKATAEHNLDRCVVACCTPRLHEPTFRKAFESAGGNPYLLEIANIREQCAWVHKDKEKATAKAHDLVRGAVAKVRRNFPLSTSTIPITSKALVIGAGIAGMQAAIDIADAGYKVVLLDREPTIGGKMVQLDKTFPTLDCSA
jgi:heterodisulfide reductase subunit A-like polyferredoxin